MIRGFNFGISRLKVQCCSVFSFYPDRGCGPRRQDKQKSIAVAQCPFDRTCNRVAWCYRFDISRDVNTVGSQIGVQARHEICIGMRIAEECPHRSNPVFGGPCLCRHQVG